MVPEERPSAILPGEPGGGRDDFTLARLRWLIRLRWVAMAGVALATVLSAAGAFPGVAWPVLATTCAAGAAYNFLLWRSHRTGEVPTGWRAAMTQALVDLVLLTLVLWAAGGVSCPFVGYYVFHVALIGILGGPRATGTAAAASLAFAGLLSLTELVPVLQIGRWDPVPPWHHLSAAGAFVTTVGAAAYIITHAMRELRDRERALERARDRAALEYQVLSNTLDELEAGLEVVEADGRVLWRNKRAEELTPLAEIGQPWRCPGAERPCERDATGVCPIASALERHAPGRCRFGVTLNGIEHVYEMMVFPLAIDQAEAPRAMNLYVDRTHAMLAERRLVIAERLASLGRIAQGVAHELNTPLATIRTLATDMRAALRELAQAAPHAVADLDESAELIGDETRRLGRITQALLAGGDLARGRVVDGAVPLAAVVERARALVFAGARRGGPALEVGEGIDALSAAADPDRLVQVLVNLLQNACDAVRGRDDGHLLLRARRAGREVELVIEDDGPGIDPSIEAHLFEPFATTKPPGEGTGLGLYTSYMLVREMGGDLALERREQGGTRAVVRLPAGAVAGNGLARSAVASQRAAQ